MINKFKFTALAGAMLLSFNASAYIVIDTFDDATAQSVYYSNITPNVLESSVATISAIGGFRDMSIAAIVNASTPVYVDPSLSVSNGVLNWTNGTASSIATIRYDGGGAGKQLNLGLDLSSLTSALLEVKYSDANFPFSIKLFTSAADYTTITLAANPVAQPGGSQGISLSLFDTIGVKTGLGIDFTNVNAIEFVLVATNMTGTPGTPDAILDRISVVPEPASLALAGLGLFGLGCLRRRSAK